MNDDRDDTRDDDSIGSPPPEPPGPFDPSRESGAGRTPEPEDEQGHLTEEQVERLAPLHEGVSMDTEHLHGDPGAGTAEHLRAARLRAARGSPRPLDGVLLRGHGALARGRPGARDRRRQLLRHPRADVGLHDRLPDPEPGPQPVRRRRDPGRLRAGLPGEARAGGPPRGIPARLAADPADDGGAGSADRGVRAGGAGPGADLRPGVRGRAAGPDGHPLAAPVPDPDPARGNRDDRRHPQQRRPLRGVRDLAVLLEPGDHRRAGGAGAHLLGGGPDLRLRDRRAGRHRDPARDPRLGPAPHQVRRRAAASG